LHRNAESIDDRDPADETAEGSAPPAGLPVVSAGDAADHEGTDDPADQVSHRRPGEHRNASPAARQQRQSDQHQDLEDSNRGRSAPGPQNRAREHHSEGLGGDGHGAAEDRNCAGDTENSENRGEDRDAGDVADAEGRSGSHRGVLDSSQCCGGGERRSARS
jgi:hypothetical protein